MTKIKKKGREIFESAAAHAHTYIENMSRLNGVEL